MSPIDNDDPLHNMTPVQGEVNPIAFGRVLGRLDAQAQDIQGLKQGQEKAMEKLDQILAYQHKQKGAASVLLMMSSGVAGIVSWLATHWFNR